MVGREQRAGDLGLLVVTVRGEQDACNLLSSRGVPARSEALIEAIRYSFMVVSSKEE